MISECSERRNKMNLQKKHIQIIAILVVGLWIGCIVFAVSAKITKEKYAAATTTAPSTEQATFAPATTAAPIETEKTTQEKDEATAKAEGTTKQKETTTKKPSLSVPQTKSDIVKAYISAVNNLKHTDNFSVVKMEDLSVEIDEITGGSASKALVQKLIDQNSNKTPQTYKFVNGENINSFKIDEADAKGMKPVEVIAPRNVDASLAPGNVVSATAKKMSNNAYKVTINLGKQTQTLSSPAPGYSSVINVVDPSSLNIPNSVSISEMNITYDNTVIEATIDSEGRILSMKQAVEVPTADIQGKVTIANVSLRIHGKLTASYTVTY